MVQFKFKDSKVRSRFTKINNMITFFYPDNGEVKLKEVSVDGVADFARRLVDKGVTQATLVKQGGENQRFVLDESVVEDIMDWLN